MIIGLNLTTWPRTWIFFAVKLGGLGKDPLQNSLDTVKAFYADATAAGFDIPTS